MLVESPRSSRVNVAECRSRAGTSVRRSGMRRTIGAARLVVMLAPWSMSVLPAHAEPDLARVLVLNGTDPYLPAYLVIDSGIRASLAQETARPIELFSEPLDAQRFPTGDFEPELVAHFAKKYRNVRVDVVLAISLPALDFYRNYGQRLWPGARVVFSGWPGEDFDPEELPAGTTAAVAKQDISGTIALARRLQPGARRILVISGSSDLDQRNERKARAWLSSSENHLPFDFLVGLPLQDLVLRVGAEPPDTIVFYLAQFRDRNGRPYIPREVVRAFSAGSKAPVYGIVETYLGFGIAAGFAESYEEHGRLLGRLIRDALAGVSPASDQALHMVPDRCIADGDALERWSLDASKLPAGCEIRFADPPLWRHYAWQVALALTLLIGQGLLITGLIAQSRRRRVAEGALRRRFSEMAHMNRRIVIGELAAAIAHELNQPLGAIYNNVGAAQLLISEDPPQLEEVAEILEDIKKDDKRASDVIGRIRKMLLKTESEAGTLDLNEVIGDTMRLLAVDASHKGVSTRMDLEPGLAPVRADRVQVQQVILNLALNSMDALYNRSAGDRQLSIGSRRIDHHSAEVSVVDSGPGIPQALLPHIFDPFVTSKPSGMGLGLSISRTIIEAHGGRIRAENLPLGGAAVHFTLPFETRRPA
jgi:signal transduction histidine kinase